VSTNIGYLSAMVTTSKAIDRGYRFPADVIQPAVWLSIRVPLGLQMVKDLLAARGIIVSHEAVRCRAENAHLPTRRQKRIMKRFTSARHLQRFVFIHDGVANLHNFPRHAMSSSDDRALRSEAMAAWRGIAEPGIAA
jgi:transposase-like protein